MTFVFKHVAWVDLAFNLLTLMIFFIFSDRIGYKIQTFGLVYLFIILGLIGLTAISALSSFLSVRISIILGCLLFVPSGLNLLWVITLASD
ncbi:hypothetical protein [Leptolyngbya iicbica]|uniref:Uncharacterized protein n=2 Tax=Cyanophyceae TaxID=3028117 RepID=A0A4Q7E845_9CYAN|nr:hypothetical protein [Leptolyngbya sp. LK]RZM78967.1 hypothetical protein DYY88_09315 [Leptolyngbya sp. LK]